MGDLTPIIEGPLKYRDGKKWKSRFGCVTRLSPVADSLTLQFWKDKRDWEKNPPTKGSIALEEYLGWEAGFTLDKESFTLAIIQKQALIALAFDCKESLMRWQVRLTSQFEEGHHVSAHMLKVPPKSKFPMGPIRLHLQNRRFSITHGVPPKLVHSWNLIDLPRYGSVEQGRFCFEGGSRCGKGEGVHLLRLDNPEELERNFQLATCGKLEHKRLVHSNMMMSSPSIPSNLGGVKMLSKSSDLSIQDPQESSRNLDRQRCHSRSINNSLHWSSTDGQSSCDTMSVAMSEMTVATNSSGGRTCLRSPDHLVSRRMLLDRMGLSVDHDGRSSRNARSTCTGSEFNYPQWTMNHPMGTRSRNQYNSSYSMDRLSLSSHDSQSSGGVTNYDTPKNLLQGSRPPSSMRSTHLATSPRDPPNHSRSPNLTPKAQRRNLNPPNFTSQPLSAEMRRVLASSPCACSSSTGSSVRNSGVSIGSSIGSMGTVSTASSSLDNYDIPRTLGKQEIIMQNYDIPRCLKESEEGANTFGNYDFPQNGALPVYRKSCGCVMKLPSQSSSPHPDCVHSGNPAILDAQAPRIKLTGTGKMPVVDMRGGFRVASPASQEEKRGGQTSPAVYAMVNKGAKLKASNPVNAPNYCNVLPDEPNYANMRNYQNLPVYPNYANTDPQHPDHLPLLPRKASVDLEAGLPMAPFSGPGYGPASLSPPVPPHQCDSINRKLRQLSDALNPPPEDPTPPPLGVPTSKSKSTDHLDILVLESPKQIGFVTVPRKTNRVGQGSAAMRRSASVPCKRPLNRDSTSSSDSGFSAGSPNGTPAIGALPLDDGEPEINANVDDTVGSFGNNEEDTKI